MQHRTTFYAAPRRRIAPARFLLAFVLVVAALIQLALPPRAALAAPEAATLIDVTISLYSKPDTADKRAPYEKIIQYFADGVYEASNGANKIATVRIYTGGRFANFANVVWVQNCHPNGAISGYGTPGMRVSMCDKFSTADFLADDTGAKGGGYTMAHEWGHYFYSLYDEYVGAASYDSIFTFPHSTDTAVNNSIMNSQWNATGGNFAWLNFSTALNATGQTAQQRTYGASAWATLVRPLADDPRDGERAALPQRLVHSELAAVAPAAGQSPAINLPGDPRSDLKIVWVENLVYQIVIDHSGSMDSENKLANAKTAAKLLVDLSEVEASIVGVLQFDHAVSVVQPLTPIANPGVKTTIKAQIDTIGSGGNTAIGDAAKAALDGLLAYNAPDSSPVVFLLSDGQQTAGSLQPLDVTADYILAGVPLYTFGYGSDADGYTLGEMALQTGGEYYFSPTSLAELNKVFQDANERVSPTVGITAGSLNPQSGAPAATTFPLDSTLGEATVAVTYPGAQDAVSLSLTGPGGATAPAPLCSTSAQDTLCVFTVPQPPTGGWTLNSTTSGGPVAVDYRVSGRGDDVFTFGATLDSLGGAAVTYPQPIVLLAILGKELPITGALVSGEMHTPAGTVVPISLRDDGVAPDALAQDGLYSAIVGYSGDGVYTFSVQFDNSQGTAAMTAAGFAPSIGPDGQPVPLGSPTPVSENFVRLARTQVTVTGSRNDDHANDISSATNMTPNNTDVPGRIDYAGDVDFFRVSPAGAAVVRIANLALGMNPRLRVYAQDGTTLLADATLASDASARGYLSLPVSAAQSVLYLAVTQVGDQTVGGLYDISVGPGVAGDNAAAASPTLYLPLVSGPLQVSSLFNGAFEEGPSSGWISYSSGGWPLIMNSTDLGFTPHSGNWAAWLGGAPNETSILEQNVTIAPGASVLTFYHIVGSQEQTCGNDRGAVLINSTVVDNINLCVSASFGEWRSRTVNLSAYAGQTVTLGFRATLNGDNNNSNLFIDSISFGSSLSADVEQAANSLALPAPAYPKH